MDVYWLEQCEADVPAGDDWLSASELERLSAMRFAKRRTDWRLGRWTAKCVIAECLGTPRTSEAFSGISIIAAASGAPEVLMGRRPGGVTISITHRGGIAACALVHGHAALGCDLEFVEPNCESFLIDYLANEERVLVARAPDQSKVATLLWSGKESVLKALNVGLREDTRAVIVTPEASGDDSGWNPLRARVAGARVFEGWYQQAGRIVRTLVADPRPNSPTVLNSLLDAYSGGGSAHTPGR